MNHRLLFTLSLCRHRIVRKPADGTNLGAWCVCGNQSKTDDKQQSFTHGMNIGQWANGPIGEWANRPIGQ